MFTPSDLPISIGLADASRAVLCDPATRSAGNPAERVRQIRRHPRGEVRVARVAADVDERNHGDRLAGGRRRRQRGAGRTRRGRGAAIREPRTARGDRRENPRAGERPQHALRAPRARHRGRRERSAHDRRILERSHDVGRALRTLGRLLLEQLHEKRVERGGHVVAARADRRRRLGQMRGEQLLRRDARGTAACRRASRTRRCRARRGRRGGRSIGSPAACSGAMYAGVPIDVPTMRDRAAPISLRQRTPRFARRRERLGDAEVGDRCRPRREQDVVRLDVAVDDAAPVRVDERARDVLEDAHRLADRERPARRAGSAATRPRRTA